MGTLLIDGPASGEIDEPEISWRDRAIDRALHAQSMDGNGEDALLAAVRRALPGRANAMFRICRSQLIRFLHARCDSVRSLVSGSDWYRDTECRSAMRPYVGWYGARFEGKPVEIAFAPGWYNESYVVLITPDLSTLQRLTEAAVEYSIRPPGRCLRYADGWEAAPDFDRAIGSVTWDDIVLAPDTLARIREAIEGFAASREAFRSIGFAWRRGVLLIGPPGTGKTMVCKAASAALPEMPFLYVRSVAGHRDRDTIQAIFERARRLAPCILTLEDLDGFVGQDNRTIFLNELDGFKNNEGMLVIASSNHPERIDEALLKRPARFDRVFHLGMPAAPERAELCRRLLLRLADRAETDSGLDLERLALRIAEKTAGFTPAYLKESVLSAALQQAQSGACRIDGAFGESVLRQVKELRAQMRRVRDPESLTETQADGETIGRRRWDQEGE